MAKHRKPGRPKGSKNKTHRGGLLSNVTSEIEPKALREALGIVLFVVAVIIFFGLFHMSGSFGIALNDFLSKLIGWAVYILPIVLAAFSVGLFFPEKMALSGLTLIGITGFVASFAGMFQIFIDQAEALEKAQAGAGGGIIGYYIQFLMLKLAKVF